MRHSAFIRTDLEALLRGLGIDSLVAAGAFVDGCVGLTADDAYERDLRVLLAGEAVESVDESRGAAMLGFLAHEFETTRLSTEAITELLAR